MGEEVRQAVFVSRRANEGFKRRLTRMYEIIPSRRFVRSYKKLKRSGRFDPEWLRLILEFLREGTLLPFQYQDHLLAGEYQGCHECHIKSDLLLIYEVAEGKHEITLVDIGSHSDLFG